MDDTLKRNKCEAFFIINRNYKNIEWGKCIGGGFSCKTPNGNYNIYIGLSNSEDEYIIKLTDNKLNNGTYVYIHNSDIIQIEEMGVDHDYIGTLYLCIDIYTTNKKEMDFIKSFLNDF